MVDALTTVLAHHARADLPLPSKLHNVILKIMKLRENWCIGAQLTIVLQLFSNVHLCKSSANVKQIEKKCYVFESRDTIENHV